MARDAPWLQTAVERYPLLIFAAGLLLSWRFGRSRVAAALLGLLLFDRFLRPVPVSSPGLATALASPGATAASFSWRPWVSWSF